MAPCALPACSICRFARLSLLFVLKIVASIASLGSGFRGGLFFSSLLIGALGGHLLAVALTMFLPTSYFDPNAYAVIGMSALAASVIGGPLTMIFIALETTGDLWLTTAVLIAVIIAAQVTREAFGYSFATWRFHLRGETIRSAADIGWMRELTVGSMMRQDVQTVHASTTIGVVPRGVPARLRRPMWSRSMRTIATSASCCGGRSLGRSVARQDGQGAVHYTDDMLLPGMAVKEAVLAFDRAEAEALAVVDSYLRPPRHRAIDRSLCAAPLRGGAGTAAPRDGRRRIAHRHRSRPHCPGAPSGVTAGRVKFAP